MRVQANLVYSSLAAWQAEGMHQLGTRPLPNLVSPPALLQAVLRRFTQRILIPLPDRTARQEVLRVILAGERLAPDVSLARLAEETEGFSGSDLRQLCTQAAMRPVREFMEAEGKSSGSGGGAGSAVRAGGGAGAGSGEGGGGGSGGEAEARGGGRGVLGPPGNASMVAEAAAAAAATASAAARALPPGDEGTAPPGGEGAEGPSPPGSQAAKQPVQQPAQEQQQQQSLVLLPHLDSLLRQAERIAGGVGAHKAELRPVSAVDFEAARKEVTPSVDPDSATVQVGGAGWRWLQGGVLAGCLRWRRALTRWRQWLPGVAARRRPAALAQALTPAQ